MSIPDAFTNNPTRVVVTNPGPKTGPSLINDQTGVCNALHGILGRLTKVADSLLGPSSKVSEKVPNSLLDVEPPFALYRLIDNSYQLATQIINELERIEQGL
jgi:hypothetical protein